MMKASVRALVFVLGAVALAGGCSDDDDNSNAGPDRPELTGAACETVDDCYQEMGVDRSAIQGEIICLADARGGYCTHRCTTTADCCAADGECRARDSDVDLAHVCTPFESFGGSLCFLSCESADVQTAGAANDQEYCQHEAASDFICRASGGGDPHKICFPADCGIGSYCADNDPVYACTQGECLDFNGTRYCGIADCTLNTDCPDGSVCVAHEGRNHCLRTCAAGPADCNLCRSADLPALDCTNQVTFADPATDPVTTVCVP